MKTMIVLIGICLIGSTCKKTEMKFEESKTKAFRLQLLDTLTFLPIAGCKVYLCSTQGGVRTILSQYASDSSGYIECEWDTNLADMTAVFSSNDYAYRECSGLSGEKFYLYPYVATLLHYSQFNISIENRIDGSFNEAPLFPKENQGSFEIHSPVYEDLIVKHIQTNDTFNEILHYKKYINKQYNELSIP